MVLSSMHPTQSFPLIRSCSIRFANQTHIAIPAIQRVNSLAWEMDLTPFSPVLQQVNTAMEAMLPAVELQNEPRQTIAVLHIPLQSLPQNSLKVVDVKGIQAHSPLALVAKDSLVSLVAGIAKSIQHHFKHTPKSMTMILLRYDSNHNGHLPVSFHDHANQSFTGTLLLNTPMAFEGGEILLKHRDNPAENTTVIKPRQHKAILWPEGNSGILHAVNPVPHGRRNVIILSID